MSRSDRLGVGGLLMSNGDAGLPLVGIVSVGVALLVLVPMVTCGRDSLVTVMVMSPLLPFGHVLLRYGWKSYPSGSVCSS